MSLCEYLVLVVSPLWNSSRESTHATASSTIGFPFEIKYYVLATTMVKTENVILQSILSLKRTSYCSWKRFHWILLSSEVRSIQYALLRLLFTCTVWTTCRSTDVYGLKTLICIFYLFYLFFPLSIFTFIYANHPYDDLRNHRTKRFLDKKIPSSYLQTYAILKFETI